MSDLPKNIQPQVDQHVEVFKSLQSPDDMAYDPKRGKDAGELGKSWKKHFVSPPFTKPKMKGLV